MELLTFLFIVAIWFAFVLVFEAPILFVFGLLFLLFFITSFFREHALRIGRPEIFNYELTPFNTILVVFLLIALVALGERALYDIARLFSGPNWDYFDNLQTIIAQAMFVIPVFIVSIILNVALGEKKEKYAVALVPYLSAALILTAQLSFQIMVYFYNNHTTLQLYVVMSLLALISSVAIFIIQYNLPTAESTRE